MESVMVVLIILLILISLVNLFMLTRSSKEKDLIERMGRFELNISKELTLFNKELNEALTKDFDKLNLNVERRLMIMDEKVNNRLEENFSKSNKIFMNITNRLTTIDEAQKKIESLGDDIISLQSILTDKKSRGIFGEINLKHILASVFGENNDRLYKLQHTLSTGVIVDAILFAPSPLGHIGIDSKFPLENYQNMVDKTISKEEIARFERLFKNDFKKHIDAIASKYIINEETSDQAIMFLPAEAIFAEVNAYHHDLIEYASKKRVWITSPTTLISTLTVIEMIVKNMERDKYTSVIHEELNKLGIEFDRYKERWDKLSRSIKTVSQDAENINITTDKISKKFDSISKVEFNDKELLDIED